MTNALTDAQPIQGLQDYVTLDKACVEILPLLVSQLEIANQQLSDGVNTLIEGFMQLSAKMNEIDTQRLGSKISSTLENKLLRMHRFTDDLVQAGERIHTTTISEATKEENQNARSGINRIVIRTLDVQQLAGEIRKEACGIIEELEAASVITGQNADDNANDTQLLKQFMELQMEINKMIVAFQFQDRVTQIISAVTNGTKDIIDYIVEAQHQVEATEGAIYVNRLEMKKRVENYYISAEQYRLTGEHKDDTSDDIELF